MDLLADHARDVEHDQAVVQQQDVAGAQVARQVLVVEAAAFVVAQFAVGVENERIARDEHRLVVLELADADLRALQVGHQRDFAADLARRLADPLGALAMVVGGAVREVEANHVEAGLHHLQQDFGAAGSGADRGNNLGGAMHVIPRLGGVA